MANIKLARKHVYETAATSLTGVQLKSVDDHDLDKILGREKGAAATRLPLPITQELVWKVIQIIKKL